MALAYEFLGNPIQHITKFKWKTPLKWTRVTWTSVMFLHQSGIFVANNRIHSCKLIPERNLLKDAGSLQRGLWVRRDTQVTLWHCSSGGLVPTQLSTGFQLWGHPLLLDAKSGMLAVRPLSPRKAGNEHCAVPAACLVSSSLPDPHPGGVSHTLLLGLFG